MDLIYKGLHRSEFARLELCDRETEDFPTISSNMTNEELRAVFGERGIVVAPQNDVDVDIEVYEGSQTPSETTFVKSGQITIGNRGIAIGNAPDYDEVPWPAGTTQVSVYMDNVLFGWARKVVFTLEHQD
ncbi:hypothetical protein [Altericista sp. CCNU0014]|uniref:hypothetical protein n=1 Tax=Altericista sp. CCNU0014 TaxID=3082949 RepID=UPI00384D7F17